MSEQEKKQTNQHSGWTVPLHLSGGPTLRSYISNNTLQARSRLEGLLAPRRPWTKNPKENY